VSRKGKGAKRERNRYKQKRSSMTKKKSEESRRRGGSSLVAPKRKLGAVKSGWGRKSTREIRRTLQQKGKR